ncbi:ABC transporter permease [Methanofollis fontis]|uniref:ABC transporter permease n=1 Tax=Methanofollis fontis TaxID=2052832 RepID=A0A483CV08_9EURY|nr:ABC transporter permease [Methanofollis fontis]TAJ45301.1 ABC transporter permease [Methanofollis fontis]
MIFSRILFDLARRNVRLHFLRSLLAAVGIVIGVLAITAMGIMGSTLQLSVSSQLSEGANALVIYPKAVSGDDGGITERQVRDIKLAAGANTVIPIHAGSDRIAVGSTSGYAAIYALDPGDIEDIAEVADGVSLRGGEGALVGPTLASEYDMRVGSRIAVGREDTRIKTVRVVGILEESGFSGTMMTDSGIIVSDTWFTSTYGDSGYDMVQVVVDDINDIDRVKDSIETKMNRREETVTVWDSRAFLDMINEALGNISLFVMAIGGISLIVAAVSIFNVMLMSVSERIKEIGILRSIGVQKHEISLIFLYEAAILGVAGSAVGALVSLIGGYALVSVMFQDTTYFFAPQTLLYAPLGMAIGIIVCVLSGVYPAIRAAKLNPIEALGAE